MNRRIVASILILILLITSSICVYAEPRAVAKTETESNNTFATADVVNQDDTIYGKISSTSDVDIYKVTFAVAGTANFWLGDIPSGKDYDLYVYNESGQQLGVSSGTSSSELISFQTIGATTYYFKVVGSDGDYDTNNQYKVRSRIVLLQYNYFCQNNTALSSPSFSTTNIDKLYSYNTNGSLSNESWLSQIIDDGCVTSSMAMILRNLNARTSTAHYDVRYNSNIRMGADPVSVAYANTLFPTISASGTNYIADTQRAPVYTYYNDVASGFGRTSTVYTLSGSDLAKANAIAYQLSLNPEGIAVAFEKYVNGEKVTHTIVFTATTYEVPTTYSFTLSANIDDTAELFVNNHSPIDVAKEIAAWEYAMDNKIFNTRASAYDSLFTVSDPYSGSNTPGNQVLFSNSYTGYAYSFGNAVKMIVIN